MALSLNAKAALHRAVTLLRQILSAGTVLNLLGFLQGTAEPAASGNDPCVQCDGAEQLANLRKFFRLASRIQHTETGRHPGFCNPGTTRLQKAKNKEAAATVAAERRGAGDDRP